MHYRTPFILNDLLLYLRIPVQTPVAVSLGPLAETINVPPAGNIVEEMGDVMARSYNSWLTWWKTNTTSEDYVRFVSSQVRVWKWVSEWVSEWVNEWVSGWVSEWVNVSECKWVSEWVNEWVSEWVSEWVIVSRWVRELVIECEWVSVCVCIYVFTKI